MDILRFLPYNEYQAAINANAPDTANPFATIADLAGFGNGIYGGSDNIPASTVATLLGDFTFSGGSFIRTGDMLFSEGANRTISVEQSTGAAGYDLTIQAGDAPALLGSGGDLVLKPGAAPGGTGGASGDIYLLGLPATGSAIGSSLFGTAGDSIDNKGGDIVLTTGDSSAAAVFTGGHYTVVTGNGPGGRGAIQFQNGTEGTAGYVWTSIDAAGSGGWAAITDSNGIYSGSGTIPTSVVAAVTDTFKFSGGAITITGVGSTNATNTVTFEASTGTDHFILQDDGQMSTGSGAGAALNASFGQKHNASGYPYGFGYYPTNATSAGFTIQSGGTTTKAMTVAIANNPSGSIYAIEATSYSTSGTANYGIHGLARSGSTISIGIFGEIPGGATVSSSSYVAAISGSAASNLNDKMYGGHFAAAFNNASTVYTKDIIGVYAIGTTQNGDASSTSTAIGGQFLTSGTNGSGLNMAINVPSTGNNGNVVIGANSSSANQSLVEVTGDIEILGSSNGIIAESPDGTRWRLTVDNLGLWTSATA